MHIDVRRLMNKDLSCHVQLHTQLLFLPLLNNVNKHLCKLCKLAHTVYCKLVMMFCKELNSEYI